MSKIIRIGTRDSQLAMWQATMVQQKLEKLGYKTQLVPVKSIGDLQLDKPLYEMGIVGVFTKTLDVALLHDEIDIAVHSMKDVPTKLPKGIIQTAVLERGATTDVLVFKKGFDVTKNCVIATSSLRRKTQWLNRYPHHQIVSLRGNVITRLEKLQTNNWDGAIFAKTGLERIGYLPDNHMEIHWMLPAPAQGAVMVVAQENNTHAIEATKKIDHENTFFAADVERMVLRRLEGGCIAAIGALAHIQDGEIHMEGNLLSLDGKEVLKVQMSAPLSEYARLGQAAAEDILNRNERKMMREIRKFTERTIK